MAGGRTGARRGAHQGSVFCLVSLCWGERITDRGRMAVLPPPRTPLPVPADLAQGGFPPFRALACRDHASASSELSASGLGTARLSTQRSECRRSWADSCRAGSSTPSLWEVGSGAP